MAFRGRFLKTGWGRPRSDVWLPRWKEGGRGMDWEFGVGICTLLHLKWINNKVLLYSTGNYIQSFGINHNGKYGKKECISGFPDDSVVKNLPDSAGDTIPGSGRSPGGGNGNSLQCSCLGNPRDKGAWQATDHSIAKSSTQLRTSSTCICVTESLCCIAEIATIL